MYVCPIIQKTIPDHDLRTQAYFLPPAFQVPHFLAIIVIPVPICEASPSKTQQCLFLNRDFP